MVPNNLYIVSSLVLTCLCYLYYAWLSVINKHNFNELQEIMSRTDLWVWSQCVS